MRTSGSSAAWVMNRSTDAANDSYGWWTRMSPARIAAKTSAGSSSSGGRSRGGVTGVQGGALEVRPVEVGDLPQAGEVEHAADLVAVGLARDPGRAAAASRVAGRHRPLDLEADGLAEAPPPELLLDREQEVVGLVLLDREVGVAGDPEEVVLDDLHAEEQRVEVGLDDLVEEDEPRSARPRAGAAGSAGP